MSGQSPAPAPRAATVEALANAAADRLRAETNDDAQLAANAQQALITATTSAMAAGVSLTQIVAAEQAGHARVREELGKELLRNVERAKRRRSEVEREWEIAIRRAGRLGLAHRDIAAAANVAAGTIRAILTRSANGTNPAASDDTIQIRE